MTEIPEQVTIPLHNIQRSALKSLMDNTPQGYSLEELLQLVFIKGLAALLKDRELPSARDDIIAEAQAALPRGTKSLSNRPRVIADYVGFPIEPGDDKALDELAARHPFVDEDELCRIVFSAGLRALPNDDVAQRNLTAAVWTEADGNNR